eukprot:m.89749 g.89749  ORF g.89749 m.89749 type:complete len:74 (-) comp26326_c0_seq1:2894-3115(-)
MVRLVTYEVPEVTKSAVCTQKRNTRSFTRDIGWVILMDAWKVFFLYLSFFYFFYVSQVGANTKEYFAFIAFDT